MFLIESNQPKSLVQNSTRFEFVHELENTVAFVNRAHLKSRQPNCGAYVFAGTPRVITLVVVLSSHGDLLDDC